MNTSKHAACRLGIPESVYEDELTKEINDLLKEIEFTRHGGVEAPELGRAEELVNDTSNAQRPSPDSSQPQQEAEREGQATNELKKPPTNPKSRLKTKCHFGPGTKRGRERKRTWPARRGSPPPPPLDRFTVPPGPDGMVRTPTIERKKCWATARGSDSSGLRDRRAPLRKGFA